MRDFADGSAVLITWHRIGKFKRLCSLVFVYIQSVLIHECKAIKLREPPKALDTTLMRKLIKGTRLTAEPNGKKSRDDHLENLNVKWKIRSETPTDRMVNSIYGGRSSTIMCRY